MTVTISVRILRDWMFCTFSFLESMYIDIVINLGRSFQFLFCSDHNVSYLLTGKRKNLKLDVIQECWKTTIFFVIRFYCLCFQSKLLCSLKLSLKFLGKQLFQMHLKRFWSMRHCSSVSNVKWNWIHQVYMKIRFI